MASEARAIKPGDPDRHAGSPNPVDTKAGRRLATFSADLTLYANPDDDSEGDPDVPQAGQLGDDLAEAVLTRYGLPANVRVRRTDQ